MTQNAHISGVEKDLNIQIHREMHLDTLQDFEAKQSSLTASSTQKTHKFFWLLLYLQGGPVTECLLNSRV